jgi:ArsR family transcriptional regulator
MAHNHATLEVDKSTNLYMMERALGAAVKAAALEAGMRGLAKAFKALGDGKRLQVVRLLSGGPLCVCDLATEVGAKQPLLSFHLKTLRDAGLVVPARKGKWIFYSLNEEAMGDLAEALASWREASGQAAWQAQAACCPEPVAKEER